MEGSGWRVVMDAIDEHPRPGFGTGYGEFGAHAVTHVGSLRRPDGETFTIEGASDVLDALTYLLSFCRGRHCAIGPLAGMDASGKRVWQRWSIGKVHANVPHEFSQSWFVGDNDEDDPLALVFAELLRMWSDTAWQEVLRVAIDLYATANTQESLQISLTIGQSVLELLGWTVLVEHRGIIRGDWERIIASDQLRLLLSMAGIPTAIPDSLRDLKQAATTRKWIDGPHALTDLRNAVTHPTKRRRDGLGTSDLPWEGSVTSPSGTASLCYFGCWATAAPT